MKIIIAGAGEVGFHLARLLSKESQDITVIDLDSDRIQFLESHTDLMTVTGSSISIKTLSEATVGKADLLIAVTNSEASNITTALMGKQMGAKRTIARVGSQEFLTQKELVDFKSLGIDTLIFQEELAAREIKRLLKRPSVTDSFEFSDGKLMLTGLQLQTNSPIAGKSVVQSASYNPNLNFMLVAVKRGTETIIPRGDTIFEVGDFVYFVAHPEAVESIVSLAGKKPYKIKNLMILGGSKIGKLTAQSLEKKLRIKLIEINREKSFELADALEETLVIHGDGRNVELLEEENLESMDAFVAVTGNSETNIISCLVAKKHGVKKTIALVDNIELIHLTQDIGIDTLINKKLIAANNIFRFVREGDITAMASLHGVDAEVLEFKVKPGTAITKSKIRDLKFPRKAIIGGVTRQNQGFIPMGDFQIQAEDRVVVFALPEDIHPVEKFFV